LKARAKATSPSAAGSTQGGFAFSKLRDDAAAAVAVAVWAVADWNDSFCPYLLAGSALYLLGTIGPTIGSHGPRNNGVAAVQPEQVEAADRGPAT
jgi:uncharacterized membrane protein